MPSIAKDVFSKTGEDIDAPDDELKTDQIRNVNLRDIKNVEQADKVIKEYGISEEMQKQGKEIVEDPNKYPPRDVPLFGFLLVDAGLVKREVKNTLMVAQAAERTLEAYEGKSDRVIKESFQKGEVVGSDDGEKARNSKIFEKPYIGFKKNGNFADPVSTVKAQNIQNIAELVSGYAEAKKEEGEEIPQQVKTAQKALMVLAWDSYRSAEKELAEHAKSGDGSISDEASKGANQVVQQMYKNKEPGTIFDSRIAQKMVREGLGVMVEEYKGKTDEKSQAFGGYLEGVVNKRFEQLKEVEKTQERDLKIDL